MDKEPERGSADPMCACGKPCHDRSSDTPQPEAREVSIENTLADLSTTMNTFDPPSREVLSQEFRRTRQEARRHDDRLRGILRSMRREINSTHPQDLGASIAQQVKNTLNSRFKALAASVHQVELEIASLREEVQRDRRERAEEARKERLRSQFAKEFAEEITQGTAKLIR